MTLESPTTYGEWFWGHGLKASLAESESYEKELAPSVSDLVRNLNIAEFLPPYLSSFLASLQAPSHPAWAQVVGRFTSEVADGIVGQAMGPALQDFSYKMNKWFSDLRIDKETASILNQRRKITEEMYTSRMESAGFKPPEAAAFYESRQPYPSIPEIILYSRYHGDPDNPKELVWTRFDVPEVDYDLWQWLGFQRLTTDQVLSLYKRGKYTEWDTTTELARIGWESIDRPSMLDLAYSLPNPMLLVQGNLMQEANSEIILKDISKADIHPDYAKQYLDAILTKPATEDIIAYELRRDPDLSDLDRELRKIGIHSDYHKVYKELAYPIPPVADLITMAVREAFTPEIATRFGQYEDFPPAFAAWANKKGISTEWAERYWAAHWSLPSPQQGFEMLHRGVINIDELNMLLRAQDVMPFWRDKLVNIAYRVLSRVDVRRMFRLGVLNEDEVNEVYKHMGYDETNAKRMTEFTVRQTRQTLARFTSTDIVNAYVNRYISEGESRTLLRELGIKDNDAEYIIRTATHKREWDYKSDQVSGIGNLYKKKQLDEEETRNRLNNLRIPPNEIDVLIERWTLKAKEEIEPTWTTAQTLSFLKKGLITRDRAIVELRLIGYNEERLNVYLSSVTPLV